jgi:hypothetical protein
MIEVSTDVRYHFIRECVGDRSMDIEHIRTEEQIADILMKPLGRDRFCELGDKLGIVEVGMELKDYGVKCESSL